MDVEVAHVVLTMIVLAKLIKFSLCSNLLTLSHCCTAALTGTMGLIRTTKHIGTEVTNCKMEGLSFGSYKAKYSPVGKCWQAGAGFCTASRLPAVQW